MSVPRAELQDITVIGMPDLPVGTIIRVSGSTGRDGLYQVKDAQTLTQAKTSIKARVKSRSRNIERPPR